MSWPPSNYSRLDWVKQSLVIEAELQELGFDFEVIQFMNDWRAIENDWVQIALDEFNSTTVLQVFGLALLLAGNQPLTVRSAMYRGIGTLWEDSSDSNYNKCARLILQMRRLGLVPYPWIIDGTRTSDKPSSWSGLADYAETVAHAYRKDLWERQKDYIEVFVEKDAMSGVIRPITREYDIKLNPIRGFGSETFLWSIAEEWKEIEKPIWVYYLGDHEPAGLSIETDLRRRLENFCDFSVHWERIAVTDDEFHNNPDLLGFDVTKKKYPASKLRPYLQQYGTRGVEVDAIPAPEIRERVRDAIESHIDQDAWQFLKDQEDRERQDVLEMIRNLI